MSVLLSIVGGLGLLTLGADLLVDGARRLAHRVGVSPIVVSSPFGGGAEGTGAASSPPVPRSTTWSGGTVGK